MTLKSPEILMELRERFFIVLKLWFVTIVLTADPEISLECVFAAFHCVGLSYLE